MAVATLAVSGAISVVAGLAFLLVARRVLSRAATGSRLLARRAHTTWWVGLGSYLVLQGALTLAAAFDALTLSTYLASRALAIPLLCAATWGISFYLVFLYTGEPKHARTLGALYVAVAGFFFYVTYGMATVLVVDSWIVGLEDSHPLYRLVYALVGLPPIVASLAYLGLLRRVHDPEQRYRIKLVAGSILLYVGSGLFARLATNDLVIFVTLVLFGLAAAGASLLAYYPPARFRSPGGGGA